ncbi:MAG: hypothetical protein AABY18_01140 [Candidatus Thermoplasmatota archaeon]
MALHLDGILGHLAAASKAVFGKQTFESRLLTQKATFLLKALGYPEANFSYGSHLRGVYSPALAREYYAWPELEPELQPELANDARITLAVQGIELGSFGLEAATSMLQVLSKNPGMPSNALLDHIAMIKPHVRGEIDKAWAYLCRVQLVVPDGSGWRTIRPV